MFTSTANNNSGNNIKGNNKSKFNRLLTKFRLSRYYYKLLIVGLIITVIIWIVISIKRYQSNSLISSSIVDNNDSNNIQSNELLFDPDPIVLLPRIIPNPIGTVKPTEPHKHKIVPIRRNYNSQSIESILQPNDNQQQRQQSQSIQSIHSYSDLTVNQTAILNSLTVVYDFGACGCSGWFFECINIIIGIYPYIGRLGIIVGDNCYCPGLSLSTVELLDSIRLTQSIINEWNNNIDIFISHKPPSRYPQWPYNGVITINNRPTIVIGRSMTETNTIPNSWISKTALVDQIWVPSKHSLEAFKTAGIDKNKLFIIHEPVDTDFYRPQSYSIDNNINTYNTAAASAASATLLPVYKFPTPNEFNFLSVFKFERRKGWRLLIQSFFEEFSNNEPVNLYIHTYLYNSPQPYNTAGILNQIKLYIKSELLFNDRDLIDRPLPYDKLHIISAETLTSDMPGLYRSASAFVLPTHGEGWGLPLIESMSTGLPTIATNYSGQLEFMNDNNSLLIPIDRFELATGAGFNIQESTEWAVGKLNILKQSMRYLVNNPEQGKLIGQQARIDIETQFNIESIGTIILQRLATIGETIVQH